MEGLSRKPGCLGSGSVVVLFLSLRNERRSGPRKKDIEGMGIEYDCTREHVMPAV